MPLHDWTRVPAYVYHDFHTGLLVAVRRVLNAGVLPAGYYALADQSMRTMGPDVLTLGPPRHQPPRRTAPRPPERSGAACASQSRTPRPASG